MIYKVPYFNVCMYVNMYDMSRMCKPTRVKFSEMKYVLHNYVRVCIHYVSNIMTEECSKGK